jgi:hypothetical protein
MTEKLAKVYLKGELPIGGIILDCFILNDDEKNPSRILSAKAVFNAFDRPRRGRRDKDPIYEGKQLPSFVGGKNLIPYINKDVMRWIQPIDFIDEKGQKRQGYRAEILPEICSLYLKARRDKKLYSGQKELAEKAEVLQDGFARVGIIALVDEATGFQFNRKYDALRILLETYLNDTIKSWTKKFPDAFFSQLDRIYGNEKMIMTQRPKHYGKFINTYIYDPIEKGKVNNELDKRYKADEKKHKKHQWLTDFGDDQLRLQIGRILGLLEIAPNLRWFKEKQSRQLQLVLFPELE